MLKHLLLLSGLTFALSGVAQPTLTTANTAYSPGESYLIHMCNWSPPGGSGANQTWDFSSLASSGTRTDYIIEGSSTPYGSEFPANALATYNTPGAYQYLTFDGAGMELVGLDANGLLWHWDVPDLLLKLPCTMNTSWTEDFEAISDFFFRDGSTTGLADGYGTLILPWGTVQNVLRVKVDKAYQDNGFGTIDYVSTTYFFYAPGVKVPLLVLDHLEYTQQGQTTISETGTYADMSVVGMEEIEADISQIQIWPMPVRDELFLDITLETSGSYRMELVDMTGRVIMLNTLGNLSIGRSTHNVRLDNLASGSYLLRTIGPNSSISQKIIVQ